MKDTPWFWIFVIIALCTTVIVSKDNQNTKNSYHQQVQELTKLAQAGDIQHQVQLAHLLQTGQNLWFQSGYGKDLQTAAYWYEQAALAGDAQAQFALADIWAHGTGVPTNIQNANAWYYQAAKQNHSQAQYKLAQNLETGNGIDTNYLGAIHWYTQAAQDGNLDAIYRLGVIYDDGLLNTPENDKMALFWLSKLPPNTKSAPDLSSRLFALQTLIVTHIENTEPQPIYTPPPRPQEGYYPSEHYGYGEKPTALCRDGTFSHSLGRRGVCSHHGGVRYWL